MKNKKGLVPLYFLIGAVLIFGSLAFAIGTGLVNFGSVLGLDNVYKAEYGTYCCENSGYWDLISSKIYSNGEYITCGTEEFAQECRITLENTGASWLSMGTASITINGATYDIQANNPKITISTNMKAGEKWLVKYQLGLSSDKVKIIKEAQRWEIKGLESGATYFANTDGCTLSTELKGKTGIEGVNQLTMTGANRCQNYFTDFVQVATQTYTYNGKDVICQARQIYEIDKQTLKSGETIKLQGDKLTSVDCCPTEANCGIDFKFKTNIVKECTYSSQCANGGNLFGVSQTSASYYTCDNGFCVKKTKSVECTSNAVCLQRHGAGSVCDLSPNNYGVCITSQEAIKCGDGYCDIGESKATCPTDCSLECKDGEKAVTTTKNVNCKFLFFFCDESVEQNCVKEGLNWFKVLAIVLGIIVLFFVLTIFVPALRGFRKLVFKF